MRPTLELLGELAEQTRSLVQIELSLVRAELRERGALIFSSATKVGVGLVFLPIGLALIFVALSLALRRFGIPADLSIVALLAIAGGSLAQISGLKGLKPVGSFPPRASRKSRRCWESLRMALTSGDYEAQANRLRSQTGQTVDELRSNSHERLEALDARNELLAKSGRSGLHACGGRAGDRGAESAAVNKWGGNELGLCE